VSIQSISFVELKEKVSIEQVLPWLGVTPKPGGTDKVRSVCPICREGGDRALICTLSKGLYFCFGKCRQGGDVITLVSRAKSCTLREAAEAISAHFGAGKADASPQPPLQEKKRGFDAEAYAKGLDPAHEALAPLGVAEETYREWKAGYSTSGVLRGKLALPIAAKDGTIIAYMGRRVVDETPTLTFPNGVTPSEHIFGADKVTEGELYLVRDPLDVLKAAESGVENAVCFLCEITPQMLEMLSSLMDERKAATVTLF
jgi:DNA primase